MALLLGASLTAVWAEQNSSARAIRNWHDHHSVSEEALVRILNSFSLKKCADQALEHFHLKRFLQQHSFPSTPTLVLAESTAGLNLLWFSPDRPAPQYFSQLCQPLPKGRRSSGQTALTFQLAAAPGLRMDWSTFETMMNALEQGIRRYSAPAPSKFAPKRSPYEIHY